MEHHAADELHSIMAQTGGTDAGLPNHGKGLGQQVIQGFPLLIPCPKLLRLVAERLVRQLLYTGFQGFHLIYDLVNGL